MARTKFNYDMLPDTAAAQQARESAATIQQLLEQTAESVVQIGKLMTQVKEHLSPAVFRAWLECEFGWGPSVGSNYMQAARVFGDLDCLKQFQPSAICILARKDIPPAVVTQCIKLARADNLITYSVAHRLLKEAGHKPTNPSAGKLRKPIVPVMTPNAGTLAQLRDTVDALAANLGRLVMAQADRQSLAAKFFDLAKNLLQEPSTPAAPAASKAKPRASKVKASH